MSSLAWPDTSTDDERRMREIVEMFSDTTTLDDLGIGQVPHGRPPTIPVLRLAGMDLGRANNLA
ncbi:hypothetical protein VZC37_15720 [Gordonia sp. LSe1-13]|uniref:Uncharacterized protein n=1 Tax=Gordonia sesuvii TaxID=3116777 RepID=A0ABU7MGS3_9ACTN|nr:hypothetical protein [Gordonia sp. LSe1-13]